MKTQLKKWLIGANKTVRDTLAQFEKNKKGILFVVDKEGRLLGSVTDGDIRRAILQGKSVRLSVRIVANPNPYSLRKKYQPLDTSTLQFLNDNNIMYVPIIDENRRIIDILSLHGQIPQKIQTNGQSKNNRVLVTGGAGYIGSVLVRLLLQRNYRVRVFDSLLYGDSSIRDLYGKKKFEHYIGDTRNIVSIREAMENIDTVVHLGEIVGDPACSLDREYTVSVNYGGTQNVLFTAKNMGIKRFIYTSSCSVYGFGEKKFHEESIPHPLSLYARTKLECERLILSDTIKNFYPTVLRLGTVFGWSFRPRFDLVANFFCLSAVNKKKIILQSGKQWRPFIHVQDVARAIIKTIETPISTLDREIFNVGVDSLNVQLNELGHIISQEFDGIPIETESTNDDKRSYQVDFSKIKKKLNFHSTITLKEGIQDLKSHLEKGEAKDILPFSSNLQVLLKEEKE
ncbi:NAD-dependent epimerase/dehydratase family protein [Candidatus Gottesmanbacteria bacterium]|nr:NAD-dependent epimerase/dehydratase family protein [Candidatus Gottesmanbacteria bacterium]